MVDFCSFVVFSLLATALGGVIADHAHSWPWVAIMPALLIDVLLTGVAIGAFKCFYDREGE